MGFNEYKVLVIKFLGNLINARIVNENDRFIMVNFDCLNFSVRFNILPYYMESVYPNICAAMLEDRIINDVTGLLKK